MNEKIKNYYMELYRKAFEAHKNGEGSTMTEGECYAMNAFRFSLDKKSSEFECSDLPWRTDMKDFIESLRRAGALQIAVTDHSTALMESLHKLAKQGCTIEGLCTVTREDSWCGEEKIEGIRINLN